MHSAKIAMRDYEHLRFSRKVIEISNEKNEFLDFHIGRAGVFVLLVYPSSYLHFPFVQAMLHLQGPLNEVYRYFIRCLLFCDVFS